MVSLLLVSVTRFSLVRSSAAVTGPAGEVTAVVPGDGVVVLLLSVLAPRVEPIGVVLRADCVLVFLGGEGRWAS